MLGVNIGRTTIVNYRALSACCVDTTVYILDAESSRNNNA